MVSHSQPVLEIKELQTSFYIPEGIVRAVDRVNLSIHRSQTLGVLGESGCGKSVTALSILRLIPDPPGCIEGGAVFFEGTDLLPLPLLKMQEIRGNRISMIFQEPMTSLNPVYTIGEQIAETVITHRQLSRKEAINFAVEMLKQVGIPSPARRIKDYPHQLSGGMRQRAMIAMAIACRPTLLIADEPTTALDVTIQAQILDLLLDLQEEAGMSIMIITHDLGVIAEVSDRVVVMYAGQVVEYAPVDLIFKNAQHPYSAGLLSSIPRLGAKISGARQELKEIPGLVPNLIRLPGGCLFASRCRRAFDHCHRARPPMFKLGDDHGARCWLLENQIA
jgi:peptide/nickel transport system ATP-binding protein